MPAAPVELIRAEVLVYCNQDLLAKYSIEDGEYIIGRDSTCHIVVDADAVSRRHARLSLNGFELLIEDVGSSNGVFIDGVQVQIPTRVRSDQEVQIGAARLRIGLEEAANRQLTEALWDKDLGLEMVRSMLEARKYRVLTTIARGGMGVILQSRDLRIRRTVAMKVMKGGTQFSRENVLRFIDEAQLTGQLEHPNIVPVYELGLDEQGEAFYTMKYVKGITLAEVLRGLRRGNPKVVQKYSLATLITIFQKMCDAVAFAHSKGVIHRDLKPENVMIGAYGEVLVMDWGLAKNMTAGRRENEPETAPSEPLAPDARGFQTMHGLVVGTPPYISPEQARGDLEKIDARSDLFVLGEILYAILTLRAPISGKDVGEIIDKILASDIAPPSTFNQPPKKKRRQKTLAPEEFIALVHCPSRRVPEGLSAVVMKAMQLEPEARYQSVEEMQAEITAWQGGFPTKAERASVIKHTLLFMGRHKGEVALLGVAFVFFNLLVAAFIYQLAQEKNLAQANERLAAERLSELHGTAPTYFAEAKNLLEDQKFAEALDRIDYALEQVPNDPEYQFLRGNVLQSLLRWDEAAAAYELALERNPRHKGAQLNLRLTRQLLSETSRDGKLTPQILGHLHASLLAQDRVGEALAVIGEMGRNRDLFARTWKTIFARRGIPDRSASHDDQTLDLDLSGMSRPDLRQLEDAPISGLNLNETALTDLTALKGRDIQRLSINRNRISDLSPLAGMPLKSLSAEATRINSLAALASAPLEILRIGETQVFDLKPLANKALEIFAAANCRSLKDLSPLRGAPLQNVDISRTGVSDLAPLVDSPIRELRLEGCVDLVDLYPLLEMKNLEAVLIPSQCKEIDFLRGHPSIKRLSYKKMTQPVYEFWEEFDARRLQENAVK